MSNHWRVPRRKPIAISWIAVAFWPCVMAAIALGIALALH